MPQILEKKSQDQAWRENEKNVKCSMNKTLCTCDSKMLKVGEGEESEKNV